MCVCVCLYGYAQGRRFAFDIGGDITPPQPPHIHIIINIVDRVYFSFLIVCLIDNNYTIIIL